MITIFMQNESYQNVYIIRDTIFDDGGKRWKKHFEDTGTRLRTDVNFQARLNRGSSPTKNGKASVCTAAAAADTLGTHYTASFYARCGIIA
uniref:Uncharacterized protein n=1 Tax=Trichogramma kaykai TaxID=54128 RepID=A0ABD2VVJ2_9HYME